MEAQNPVTPPEKVWISQGKAVRIVTRRLDFGLTWFKANIRPELERRGAVIVTQYVVARTAKGKKYMRTGVRIDRDALLALIDDIQASAEVL